MINHFLKKYSITIATILFMIMAAIGGVQYARNLNADKLIAESPMIGKGINPFMLKDIMGGDDLTPLDFRNNDRNVIVIFASWCGSCKSEHHLLVDLAKNNPKTAFYGIAYMDKEVRTLSFLSQNGNPFAKVGNDYRGSVTLSLGAKSLPTTIITDAAGKILFHYVGELDENIIDKHIQKLL